MPKSSDPLPTGTFRDGWDDLDKKKTAKPKAKIDDDDFDVDNLLDDLEEKKGLKSTKNQMGDTRNSGLWSAGGGASSRRDRDDNVNEDLDRLDELEDPVV